MRRGATHRLCFLFILFVYFRTILSTRGFSSLFQSNDLRIPNSPVNLKHHRCKMRPLTKPTTTIDDLPTEMINELFKHLHPKDLASCSLVNRHWHSIYVGFKVQSLAAMTDQNTLDLAKWYDLNQPIQEAERCRPAMFDRLVDKPLLSNLKHLALCDGKFAFDLNKLNRFQQLVHLEIKSDFKGKVHLNLPRLKVLAFHYFNWHCTLSIDCPLLSTLFYCGECEDTRLLKVKQPETIRKLETGMENPDFLTPFKNVEFLRTWDLNLISVRSLPRLRELHCNQGIKYAFQRESRHRPGTVDRVKRTLNEFLNEAKKLRGNNFQLRFSGFQLAKVNVDQIDFGVQTNEKGAESVCTEYVYMKNYHLLEPGALDFQSSVNYTLLLRHVTGEFPRCFPQKFTGIELVYATAEVQDADHFLRFLKSLRCLRRLVLSNTKLNQVFYDLLPASTHLLIGLHLRSGHCEDGLQLNFDFIYKLSGLTALEYCTAQSYESFSSLVRLLGRMEEAYFYVQIKEKLFRIRKERGFEWTICNKETWGSKRQTKNLNEIVNFLQGLQTS